MPRQRTISPDWWESDDARKVSPPARLVLIAAWTLADDEGLLRWEPEMLKETVFGTDVQVLAEDVNGWMTELSTAGLVRPYEGGRYRMRCAYIVGFETAQKVARPKPTTLPRPDFEVPRRPQFGSESPEILTEPNMVGLTTDSVSPTRPRAVNDPRMGAPNEVNDPTIVPLTCGNDDSHQTHDKLSEPVVSDVAGLTTNSPGERERERERERTAAPAGRGALRAPNARASAREEGSGASASAAAAPPVPDATDSSTDQPVVTTAVVDETVVTEVVDEISEETSDREPQSVTPVLVDEPVAPVIDLLSGSLEEIASALGRDVPVAASAGRSSAVGRRTGATPELARVVAADDGEQGGLFDVEDSMVSVPEKLKPKTREDASTRLTKLFFFEYRETGVAQSFPIVKRVVKSALDGGMKFEEVAFALLRLGRERRPVSGGALMMAARDMDRILAEERNTAARWAAMDPATFNDIVL